MKNLKKIIAALAVTAMMFSFAACGKEEAKQTEETKPSIDAYSTEITGKDGKPAETTPTETEIEATETTTEAVEATEAGENERVPDGAKVSNDIPLGIVKFGDYNGNELFSIDIADCTLAELIELSEEKTGVTGVFEVTNEGMVDIDHPDYKLCYQTFDFMRGNFGIETMVDGEVVTNWDKIGYATDSYADMKINGITDYRGYYKDDELTFCDGIIKYNTPRYDVETLLGEGKAFNYTESEVRYVYENDSAKLVIKYDKNDSVKEIYLFANN